MTVRRLKNLEQLRLLLLAGPKRSTEIQSALQISQTTVSRFLREGGNDIRNYGRRKGAFYARLRPIDGIAAEQPIFRIGPDGKLERLGTLTSIQDRGFVFEPEAGKAEWYPGIPYFLQDARPQGYSGRAFARIHEDLGFPDRLQDWSENQLYSAVVRRGEDLPGNLLVGEESFARLQKARKEEIAIPLASRAAYYPKAAELAQNGEPPGSSAAGEQPKFGVFLKAANGKDFRRALVKFSPPIETPKGRRWADLLLAEWHVAEVVRESGFAESAGTDLVESEGRVFLESTRFDRLGAHGRLGVMSFGALELEWLGKPSNWSASARELARKKLIEDADARKIAWLDAFGAMIANTDRHYGNLSFFFDFQSRKAKLAPVYDMLPMLYAPKESEVDVFERTFEFPMPSPEGVPVWDSAKDAAQRFWERIQGDRRISAAFRKTAWKGAKV